MNKSLRLIWALGGSVILLTIIAYAVLHITGLRYLPKYFFITPVFFLLLTFLFGLFVKKHSSKSEELTVANIIGIRGALIAGVVLVLVVNIMIDREHALPVALIYLVYEIVFSAFETKILLTLNKKN